MKRNIVYTRLFALLLAAAFSFIITPGELLHACAEHHDSTEIHSTHPDCAATHHFEIQHHHCNLLEHSYPPYYFTGIHFRPVITNRLFVFPASRLPSYYFQQTAACLLRGPPHSFKFF